LNFLSCIEPSLSLGEKGTGGQGGTGKWEDGEGESFEEEIKKGIEGADNFVYLNISRYAAIAILSPLVTGNW
jgi:hypothetical protein